MATDAAMESGGLMNLDMQVDGEHGLIRVRGELDQVDVPRLYDAADMLLGDGVRDLVIDCHGHHVHGLGGPAIDLGRGHPGSV